MGRCCCVCTNLRRKQIKPIRFVCDPRTLAKTPPRVALVTLARVTLRNVGISINMVSHLTHTHTHTTSTCRLKCASANSIYAYHGRLTGKLTQVRALSINVETGGADTPGSAVMNLYERLP